MALSGIFVVVDDVRKGAKLSFSYPMQLDGANQAAADAFAKMLRPKAGFCDQLFCMLVDDSTFVSFPVLMDVRSRREMPRKDEKRYDNYVWDGEFELPSTTSQHTKNDKAFESDAEPVPFFNVGFIVSDAAVNATADLSGMVNVLRTDVLLSSLSDAVARTAAGLRYEEERCGYVTRQAQLLNAVVSSSRQDRSSPAADNKITSPSELQNALQSIVCHSLPVELQRLFLASNDSAAVARLLSLHPVLAVSSLARELFTIFHCLAPGLGSVCHVRFNSWISASLSLSASAAHSLYQPTSSTGGGAAAIGDEDTEPSRAASSANSIARATTAGGVWAAIESLPSASNVQPIRPYHTLLLLKESNEILASLPPDASPQLAQLLRVASPLRSFHELQGETGIPSSQLLRLAGHLVHWGLAVITNVITQHSVYTVAPGVDLGPACAAAREFDALFAGPITEPNGSNDENGAGGGNSSVSGFTLASVLSLFSKTTSTVSVLGPGAGATSTNLATSATSPTPFSSSKSDPFGTPKVSGASASAKQQPAANESNATAAEEVAGEDASLVLPIGSGLPLRTLMGSMPAGSAAYTRFLDALVWLLKRGYLRQMHTNVYLLWPWPLGPRERAEAVAAGEITLPEGSDGASTSSPGVVPWSAGELAYLAKLCRSRMGGSGGQSGRPASSASASLIVLFRRLVAYLRDVSAMMAASAEAAAAESGGGPAPPAPASLQLGLRLEEIMWRLRVSRADLQAVISAFPQVLLVSIHE